jgi:hypothetical protein
MDPGDFFPFRVASAIVGDRDFIDPPLFVFADQVAQLPNVTGSITVTSNYVLVTTALIAAKLLKELKNWFG